RQDRVASDEHAGSDGDPGVAIALRVDQAVVVDHHVVADADLVRMAQHDVLAEDDVPAARAEERREERLAQRETERAGHVLAEELHEFVVKERAPAGPADHERRVPLACRLPAREQLLLGPGNLRHLLGLYDKARMPRWIIPASVAAIVLARAAVFVVSPEA